MQCVISCRAQYVLKLRYIMYHDVMCPWSLCSAVSLNDAWPCKDKDELLQDQPHLRSYLSGLFVRIFVKTKTRI